MKEYLYIDQLSELTPWSANAIRIMVARGTFQQGVHYFKPQGNGGRPIFRWSAIVRFIEGESTATGARDEVRLANGNVVDLG